MSPLGESPQALEGICEVDVGDSVYEVCARRATPNGMTHVQVSDTETDWQAGFHLTPDELLPVAGSADMVTCSQQEWGDVTARIASQIDVVPAAEGGARVLQCSLVHTSPARDEQTPGAEADSCGGDEGWMTASRSATLGAEMYIISARCHVASGKTEVKALNVGDCWVDGVTLDAAQVEKVTEHPFQPPIDPQTFRAAFGRLVPHVTISDTPKRALHVGSAAPPPGSGSLSEHDAAARIQAVARGRAARRSMLYGAGNVEIGSRVWVATVEYDREAETGTVEVVDPATSWSGTRTLSAGDVLAYLPPGVPQPKCLQPTSFKQLVVNVCSAVSVAFVGTPHARVVLGSELEDAARAAARVQAIARGKAARQRHLTATGTVASGDQFCVATVHCDRQTGTGSVEVLEPSTCWQGQRQLSAEEVRRFLAPTAHRVHVLNPSSFKDVAARVCSAIDVVEAGTANARVVLRASPAASTRSADSDLAAARLQALARGRDARRRMLAPSSFNRVSGGTAMVVSVAGVARHTTISAHIPSRGVTIGGLSLPPQLAGTVASRVRELRQGGDDVGKAYHRAVAGMVHWDPHRCTVVVQQHAVAPRAPTTSHAPSAVAVAASPARVASAASSKARHVTLSSSASEARLITPVQTRHTARLAGAKSSPQLVRGSPATPVTPVFTGCRHMLQSHPRMSFFRTTCLVCGGNIGRLDNCLKCGQCGIKVHDKCWPELEVAFLVDDNNRVLSSAASFKAARDSPNVSSPATPVSPPVASPPLQRAPSLSMMLRSQRSMRSIPSAPTMPAPEDSMSAAEFAASGGAGGMMQGHFQAGGIIYTVFIKLQGTLRELGGTVVYERVHDPSEAALAAMDFAHVHMFRDHGHFMYLLRRVANQVMMDSVVGAYDPDTHTLRLDTVGCNMTFEGPMYSSLVPPNFCTKRWTQVKFQDDTWRDGSLGLNEVQVKRAELPASAPVPAPAAAVASPPSAQATLRVTPSKFALRDGNSGMMKGHIRAAEHVYSFFLRLEGDFSALAGRVVFERVDDESAAAAAAKDVAHVHWEPDATQFATLLRSVSGEHVLDDVQGVYHVDTRRLELRSTACSRMSGAKLASLLPGRFCKGRSVTVVFEDATWAHGALHVSEVHTKE